MSGEDKAWGGRFQEATAKIVEAMNASVAFDARLALEDISGSVAHARMLQSQGLISSEDHLSIENGLTEIAVSVRAGDFVFTVAREDVHMNVEGALKDKIGAAAGRLHTGRSRNDQVALDLRLWLRRAQTKLVTTLGRALEVILDLAQTHVNTPMPGYTHLQRAQPITFGHHLMAYVAMFLRDADRLLDARKRTAVLPLGSGALAGSPLPLDRAHVARTLEMDTLSLNSLDAVSDRDPALESLATLAILMVHVSRLAEEITLWCSQEFGFVELSDGFCTGSSLMPQKKNPDIPELLRGKSGRVFGDLQALLTVMKGLPLAYNKDLQEDKEPVFDAFDTVQMCLEILPDMLEKMTVCRERMSQALKDGFVLATDMADYLVDQGVPFREAHHVVGQAVAVCLDRGVRLDDLSPEDLIALHPSLDAGCRDVLDVTRSIARRDLPGAPAPARVEAAIVEAKTQLTTLLTRAAHGGPSALEEAIHQGMALP
jgi:argininosuccinate lyase